MCTQARIPSPSRRNESASSKSFAVSGSIVNVVSSRRSTRPSSVGSGELVRLERGPRAALDEQRLEHVSIRSGAPEHALDPRAAPPEPDDGEVARARGRRSPFASSTIGVPGAKYGSPTTSLPRRDLDDDRVGRTRPCCRSAAAHVRGSPADGVRVRPSADAGAC